MSQRNHPSCTQFGLFCRRPLVQGLSWIGGIGVLSSGLVWAQSDPSVDTIGTPTTQEAPPTVKMETHSPRRTEPTVVRRRSVSAPEPEPNVVRRRSAPAAENASSGVRRRQLARQRALETTSVRRRRRSAPEPAVVRRRSLPVSAPETSVAVPRKAKLSPPRLVEPNTISYVKPPKLRPSKAEKSGISSSDYNNSYIDPTDYSVGATSRGKEPIRSYDEPPAVVLSERSTGCQRVLQSGQGLSGGSCGVARIPSRNTNRLRETARLTYPTRSRREYASDTDVPEALRTSGLANRRVSRARLAVNQPEREIRQQILVASASPVAISPRSDRPQGIRSINRRRSRSLGSSAVTRSTAIASNNVGSSQSSIPFNVPEYKAPIPTIFRGLANGNTSLIFPLAIPAPITSLFGWRTHPISGTRRFHAGTDLGAPLGTPVLAAFAGKVAIADWMGGYGQAVVLKHNETQETLYAHLSEILVQPGQQIEQGTVIGRVGSTGNSTGPHLHFEIRQLTQEGWMAVDSDAYLEYGLAQMIKALQTAHSAPAAPATSSAPLTPQPGS
ncbi:M23 family metallopeptidase [Coleofasciculus sp. FACHB-712]|uniref:M23 family metallopeptidase n=1 Tax=Cyanophyceae TaxID=3028117 RepID=UPI001685E5A2|nr:MULTISPECIES: M23 family metallopeptidase [unclassified Coleofasciculus]MBD1944122.1 M23 family metallopeptidase [Coleofasciculus sp. FACHB-712]MBD2540616.1 M23 family metallopeptidase [Coleofasciculus sp. FACHB-SPT36]